MDGVEAEMTDWNMVWGSQMALWGKTAGKSCGDFWADESAARVYSEKHGRHHRERVETTIRGLDLGPESRVLDIGAGPGNLALPMAGIVRSVTAVEPSPGMNAVMSSDIAEQGIANIIRVEKTWEDVLPARDLAPPFDLVLASMSLGMSDIRSAVEKMNRVCSGRVVIFWHAGIPGWEEMPRELWPDLFGMPYHGGPKSDILFQVLYQMGIYPDVRVFSHHFTETFPDLDAAMGFYLKRFDQIRPAHYPALKSYLDRHCTRTDRGVVHGFNHISMRFTWPVHRGCHEKT